MYPTVYLLTIPWGMGHTPGPLLQRGQRIIFSPKPPGITRPVDIRKIV